MAVAQKPDRPEGDSDAAREGTAAAWVAECVIKGLVPDAAAMFDKVHENGWSVDAEMVRHVQWYCDLLMLDGRQCEAENFMQAGNGLQGTADGMAYLPERNFLFIWDLKYGYKTVKVRENWQLLCYLWLYIATTGIWPDMVQLAICQPRSMHEDGPYRKWVINRAEYEPYLNRIGQRIIEITQGDHRAVTGPHCAHCVLAAGCDALTQSVYALMDRVSESRLYRTPTPQQLADELTTLERFKTLFEARYNAVYAEAEARLHEAAFVPGYMLEKRFGKKKFTVSDSSIRMITGIDPTDTKTCTPAELIRRGAKKEVVDTITTTPFIGTKLKRVDPDDITAKFNEMKGQSHG